MTGVWGSLPGTFGKVFFTLLHINRDAEVVFEQIIHTFAKKIIKIGL